MHNLLNIKKLAEDKKVTIRELGEYCGVTAESIHRSIKSNNMSLFTLDKICEYFGLAMDELIDQQIKGLPASSVRVVDANEYLLTRFEQLVSERDKLKEMNVTLRKENLELKKKLGELRGYGAVAESKPK